MVSKRKTIYYVVDSKGWVQHRRVTYLKKYITNLKFKVLSTRVFLFSWKLGFLKKSFIYFPTWRIVHSLLKKDSSFFDLNDYSYFMTSVTSHMNIGGGLRPEKALSGRSEKEAIELAVALLRRFKVVTANSLFLFELLNKYLDNIYYCPNGVDTELFKPKPKKDYNPNCIRIGWVGKKRASKNYEIIEKACKELEKFGFKSNLIALPKNFKKAPLSPKQMRKFYWGVDFYLCASWNEGTPNPALEAGACGVPVVSTCVGNMRELIRPGENGFFIEPTVESVVEQFKKISTMDRQEYYRMSGNMRDSIVRDWSWGKRVGNFISAFDKLEEG